MVQRNNFAVVIAGGQGTRLWPLSRVARPKQFLPLASNGQTLIQAAVDRAVHVTGELNQVLVVAPIDQAELVREQLPTLPVNNLILEPLGRNTAAAVGLAAIYIRQRDPEAVMGVFPADHLFKDVGPWLTAVKTALEFANDSDHLVTIGLEPLTPSPNYGYLHLGEILSSLNPLPVYSLQRYVEKPTVEIAQTYLESGEYLWNTGTFAWKVSTILAAFAKHLPGHYAGLEKIATQLDLETVLAQEYPNFENISIDFGVMEKAKKVAAVKAHFERIDLGNLTNFAELYLPDENGTH